jgi:hypothetical protein
VAGDLEDISRRLDGIAEELGEIVIGHLRASLDAGGGTSTSFEKQVSRARRAVEKAAAILVQTEH